jgi:hypothetical protein
VGGAQALKGVWASHKSIIALDDLVRRALPTGFNVVFVGHWLFCLDGLSLIKKEQCQSTPQSGRGADQNCQGGILFVFRAEASAGLFPARQGGSPGIK